MDARDRLINRVTLGVVAVLFVVVCVSGWAVAAPVLEGRWHDAALPGAGMVVGVGLGFAIQALRTHLGLPDPQLFRPAPDVDDD